MTLLYYGKCITPPLGLRVILDYVADFDFVILHRPGTQHGNYDGLSRVRLCGINEEAPCKQCGKRMVGAQACACSADT